MIEPLNTSSFVGSDTPPERFEIPGTDTSARAEYHWNQSTQVLHRDRYWHTKDSNEITQDTYTVRLLFSQELKFFLEQCGFKFFPSQKSNAAEFTTSLYSFWPKSNGKQTMDEIETSEKTAGDRILAGNASWSFGGDVPSNFEEHVSKSVPLYHEGHELVFKIFRFLF